MSNESSASETTPLRRPDDINTNRYFRNSPQNTSPPPPTSSSSLTFNSLQTRNSHRNSNLTSSVTDPTNLASTTVAIANHNNNNIEVRLNRHSLNNNNNNNYHNNSELYIKMETNKRILYRVGLDVLILLCGKFK